MEENPDAFFSDKASAVPGDVDLGGITRALRGGLTVFLVCAGLGGFAGLGFAVLSPSKYQATTTLEVFGPSPKEDPSEMELRTVVEKLRADSLYERVINSAVVTDKLGLSPKETDAKKVEKKRAEAVRALKENTHINLRPRTRLIAITAGHRQPELAKLLADGLAEEFLASERQDRQEEAREQVALLKKQETTLQNEMGGYEVALMKLEPLKGLREIFEGIMTERKEMLNHQLYYSEDHPVFAERKARVEIFQQKLQEGLEGLSERAGDQVPEHIRSFREHDASNLSEYERLLVEWKLWEQQREAIEQKANAARELYVSAVEKMESLPVAGEFSLGTVQIFRSAQLPEKPEGPPRVLAFGLFVFMGLMAGLCAVWMRSIFAFG